MRRVVWTEPAALDLRRIRRFIAKDNPYAAERIVALLQKAGDGLAEYPERGAPVRGILRKLTTVKPYLLLYQVQEQEIHIMHIRHAARRPPRRAP